MITVFAMEVRRYLARRLTRVLIAVALLATAITGVIVFVNAAKFTPEVAAEAKLRRESDIARCAQSGFGPVTGPRGEPVESPPRPALEPIVVEGAEAMCRRHIQPSSYDDSLHLTDLWSKEGGDSFFGVTFVFLGIGALIGGASMVGAEWKANTFTTMLTWEPRRTRVAVGKLLAAGVLAVVVAIALQLVFAAALLPTVLLRGTTDGADAEWTRELLAVLARGGALTGIAAIVGASVAMIGRSTAAALGVAFAYLAVVEAVVRAWKPRMARWLIGENSAIFLTGKRLENAPFDRPVVLAAVTLVGFAVAFVAVAAVTLNRRDVAA